MSTHRIKVAQSQQWQIDEDGDTWIVQKSGSIDSADFGIHETGHHDNTIIVKGKVAGEADGIFSTESTNTRIEIASTGRVSGDSGISFSSTHTTIVNAGLVKGGEDGGIYCFAPEGLDIDNSGTIRGSVYSQAVRTNTDNSGTIYGGSQFAALAYNIGAVGIDTPDATHTDNSGRILAVRGGIAFEGANGDDILVNSGKMRGDVDLRTGDDIFYTRGGIVTGKITGGDGDDLFLTDNARYHMLENASEGYDTVKSTVSYTLNANVEVLVLLGSHDIDGTGNTAANRLFGNKGDNVLNGKDGEDTLNGKAGNDRLVGGGGDDLFVFATGYNNDVITRFDNGTDEFGMDGDKIDVSGWKAIHGFAGIKSHLEVHGDDLVIHAGGDSLTILNMPKADLDSGDFIFGGVAS